MKYTAHVSVPCIVLHCIVAPGAESWEYGTGALQGVSGGLADVVTILYALSVLMSIQIFPHVCSRVSGYQISSVCKCETLSNWINLFLFGWSVSTVATRNDFCLGHLNLGHLYKPVEWLHTECTRIAKLTCCYIPCKRGVITAFAWYQKTYQFFIAGYVLLHS